MVLAAGLVSPNIEWSQILPLLILLGGACALMLLGTLVPMWTRAASTTLSLVTAVAAIVVSAIKWNDLHYVKGATFLVDTIAVDRVAVLATITMLVALVFGILLMSIHHDPANGDTLESYVLLLTATLGGIVLLSANDLIVLFLGLEILSLSLYLLAASDRRRPESQEAGLKYFVLGGFASAFLLYGIALVYGTTSSTSISGIASALSTSVSTNNTDAMLLVGIGLLMVGLAFKVSAAPFQVWTPDVYEGAPSPVTAFMASAGKVAAFGAALRVLLVALERRVDDWRPIVFVLAVLTVFVGSIMAVVQTNVKRMLSYSSISHAGFMLVGVEAAAHYSGNGLSSTMAYLLIYTIIVMGSFAVVITVAGNADNATTLEDFKGLGKRRPALALAFSTLLFAQAGVPFTAGFVAKFGVIKSAVDVNSYAIAIAAMVAAVIGAYLYLRIVVSMWMEEPASTDELRVPTIAGIVLTLSVAFTLVVGFFPDLLLNATELSRFAPK